jgi:hypothetical protein
MPLNPVLRGWKGLMTTLLEILSSLPFHGPFHGPLTALVGPAVPAYFLSFFFSASDASVLERALTARVAIGISLLDFVFPAVVLVFFACRQNNVTFVVADQDLLHAHDEEANEPR